MSLNETETIGVIDLNEKSKYMIDRAKGIVDRHVKTAPNDDYSEEVGLAYDVSSFLPKLIYNMNELREQVAFLSNYSEQSKTTLKSCRDKLFYIQYGDANPRNQSKYRTMVDTVDYSNCYNNSYSSINNNRR